MKNIRAKRVASKGQSGGWKHAGLLLSGVGISNLGDFIYIVAINLMVLNMTQSPAAVAGLWIISPIASVCTKFWSGSLIDRYDQRQLMIGADMLRALLVAALPLMSSLWMMYAVMFLISMSSSIFVPSSQVYITRLVPAERRKRFNSLQALISSGAFITGPAVAGVMLIYLSPAAAIYANAVSFAASALILMFLPKLGIGEQNIGTGSRLTPRMIAQDWRAVLSFSRKSGYVVGIYALFQIILVVGMSLDAQEVVFIRQVMNLPESQYGALMSITGIGYLAGSMLVWMFAKHLPIRYMMGGGVLLVALGYFLFSRSFSFELAAVAFILLGLCSALANTGLVTFYQNNIPVDLMGRMSSVLGLVLSMLQVASILIAGVVAEQLSLRMVYTVVSGVMLLAALGLWVTSMLPSRSRYYDEPSKPKAMVG
ncbi:Predicted arabinose efflux permease, MFS family [Paenibacillus sp. ov031]|uniref:MFS transporter n=1 Tax=Paenibacillus sp. ov031 TaxID=1761879 RepID=UPI00091E91D4|nr:MFS transporter [Paenibacillus sp. ov031]SHN79738.1 Predicted arabinose efflux permease, MFS family [Paenibacillus sp. ov031]